MNQPQITRRILTTGEHQTILELRWFALAGSYLIEAVGTGDSPEAAETSARLLLGQARAELNEVTAKETV